MTADAKYVIYQIANGWILYFDGDETYYSTLEDLLDEIRLYENSDDIEEAENESQG